MLGNTYYHEIIKKSITVFGKLFSDIKIERKDTTGTVIQTINVPIAYAPKEKYLLRIDADPNLANNTQISLPRMSFEINGYSYDSTRKANKMNRVVHYNNATAKTQLSPVPYNLDISLYLLTKTIDDALTVVEQILPTFTPDYTLSINAIPSMGIVNDVPIILNTVSVEDDYEGDFQTRRSIIHTFNFTMKVNIFGPVLSANVIKIADVHMNDGESNFAQIVATPNPTDAQIGEEYMPTIQILEGEEIVTTVSTPTADFSGDMDLQFGIDDLSSDLVKTTDLL